MDHTTVSRELTTSRYILGELSEQEREEFEEHYFGCPDCAADLRAGYAFAANARQALPLMPPKPEGVRQSWFGFWNWRFAGLAAAANLALLTCVTYESFWLVPQLRDRVARANAPQLARVVAVPPAARGAEDALRVHISDGVLAPVFDLAQRFDSITYEMSPVSGGPRLSGDLSAPSGDQLQLSIPVAGLTPGAYQFVLRGRQGSAISEIARFRFQVLP